MDEAVRAPTLTPWIVEEERTMVYQKNSCVEHVAIRVRDIDWHIRFFRDALGMPIREVDGPCDNPQ